MKLANAIVMLLPLPLFLVLLLLLRQHKKSSGQR